jgi:hypothetical protein
MFSIKNSFEILITTEAAAKSVVVGVVVLLEM